MPITRRMLLATTAALPVLRAAHAAGTVASAPPAAPQRPVTDNIFGTRITDPYRWMETPHSAEFMAYLKAQGAYARSVFDRIPGRDKLAQAIAHYTGGLTGTRNPQAAGGKLFLEVRPAKAETYKLTVRDLPDGQPRILLDPEAGAAGKKRAINYWQVSPDGARVAFGMSEAGSEDASLRFVESATARVLPDTISRAQFGGPSWSDDNQSVAFNRLSGTDRTALDYYSRSVNWLHKLGTPESQDVKLLAQGEYASVPLNDIEAPFVSFTPGSGIALASIQNGVQNELTLYTAPANELGKPGTPWKCVCTEKDKITNVTQRGDELYLLTYDGAPRYKLLRTSAAKPAVKSAVTVVPESEYLLDAPLAARDAIYLTGRDSRGLGVLRRLMKDGTIERLSLPMEGSINSPYADPTQDGIWFQLASWTKAPILCRCGADGKIVTTDFAPPAPYDTTDYESETVLVPARDGVHVPLSILYKKGAPRDGARPTIITAYGSYGLSIDPEFASRYFAWLDLGGVFAVAHVRGGGELGRAWYEAGRKETKPNTWHDLIDCAEYMIAQKWTSPKTLGIEGTSAGGITVGRALTERPDLFAVVFSRVGVSNAARSEFSPNGPPNVPEFGSVKDPKTAHALLAMDALHHVKKGTIYPSVVLTTGLQDPRVSPWEPGKMAAALQASGSPNPVVLRVESEGGHGIGSTRSQFDDEYADLFAFALWRMGDPRFQPKSG